MYFLKAIPDDGTKFLLILPLPEFFFQKKKADHKLYPNHH
jgi:hypothetical protein